ncbi:hypothetical protein DSI96_06960, partial [Mycobacterium tuberculosis]
MGHPRRVCDRAGHRHGNQLHRAASRDLPDPLSQSGSNRAGTLFDDVERGSYHYRHPADRVGPHSAV